MLACFRWIVLALMLAVSVGSPAHAWPDKPIRIIVPGEAGGSGDIIVRMLGEKLRPLLGNTQIVVDNKPGESGGLGVAALLAATDDHTFLLMSEDLISFPLLSRSARYQPLRDFKAVSSVGDGTLVVLAGPTAPFATFSELVAYAKANPGKLSYASVGPGSASHLYGELLWGEAGIDLKHVYARGSGGTAADMADGLHQVAVIGVGPAASGIKAGKLRPLAVSSHDRVPAIPNTPTLSELGLAGLSIVNSAGIVAPQSTPDVIIERLALAIKTALTDAALRKRFEEHGATARSSTPAEYDGELETATRQWKAIIETRGLSMD